MEDMNIREFLTIKSDRLNYENFIMGAKEFKISKLAKKTDQGKARLLIYFEGHEATPYWPSLGMIKCLSSPDGWGESPFSEWIGRSMTLFGEPTVVYAGKEIGGIQISHISHIKTEYSTKITLRRGMRIDFTIEPIAVMSAAPAKPARPATPYPAEQFAAQLDKMRGSIASGKATADKIVAYCLTIGTITPAQEAAIRADCAEPTITEEDVF
jgi:hypothetical protein